MNGYVLTEEKLAAFEAYLRKEEHEKATIEKYIRNVQFFARWLEGKAVTKETVAEWKSFLQKEKYKNSRFIRLYSTILSTWTSNW